MTQLLNRAIRVTGALLLACALGWAPGATAMEDDTMPHDNGAMTHDGEMNHDKTISDDSMTADPDADGPQGDSTYRNPLDPTHDSSPGNSAKAPDMADDDIHNQHDNSDM